MKEKLSKNKILIGTVAVLLIGVFLSARYISMGTSEQFLPVSSATLTIPKFSIYVKECCMTSVTFKSFQNLKLLQKELDKIMNDYEKINCGENTYYDKEHDLTITEYGIKKGVILNEFYITFDKGKTKCENKTEMEEVARFTKEEKEHAIYTNCPTCFSKWNGNFTTIEDYIKEYENLDEIINKLEQEVEEKKVTKEIYKDGGTILYKGRRTFSLLKCHTLDGNEDIYIGDSSLNYEENYCK